MFYEDDGVLANRAAAAQEGAVPPPGLDNKQTVPKHRQRVPSTIRTFHYFGTGAELLQLPALNKRCPFALPRQAERVQPRGFLGRSRERTSAHASTVSGTERICVEFLFGFVGSATFEARSPGCHLLCAPHLSYSVTERVFISQESSGDPRVLPHLYTTSLGFEIFGKNPSNAICSTKELSPFCRMLTFRTVPIFQHSGFRHFASKEPSGTEHTRFVIRGAQRTAQNPPRSADVATGGWLGNPCPLWDHPAWCRLLPPVAGKRWSAGICLFSGLTKINK